MQETTNHSQAGKSSSSSGFAKTALRLGDSSSGANNMTSFNQAAQRKPLVITPTNELGKREDTHQCTEENGNVRNSSCETYVSSNFSVSSKNSNELQGLVNVACEDESKTSKAPVLSYISNELFNNVCSPQPLTPPLIQHGRERHSGFKTVHQQHSDVTLENLLGKRKHVHNGALQNQCHDKMNQSECSTAKNHAGNMTNPTQHAQGQQLNYLRNQGGNIFFGAQTFRDSPPQGYHSFQYLPPSYYQQAAQNSHRGSNGSPHHYSPYHQAFCLSNLGARPITQNGLLLTTTSTNHGMEPTIQDLKQQILNRRLINSTNQDPISSSPTNLNSQLPNQNERSQVNAQLSANMSAAVCQMKQDMSATQTPTSTLLKKISEIKVEELRQEIVSALPQALGQDQQIQSQGQTALQRMLFDYFIHSELSKQGVQQATTLPASALQFPMKSDSSNPSKIQRHIAPEFAFTSSSSSEEKREDIKDELEQHEKKNCSAHLKVMVNSKCPHIQRKHYAKNMCSSCYRKYGRSQNATKCPHSDRMLYSMGMCQTCYLADYHKRRCKSSLELVGGENGDLHDHEESL